MGKISELITVFESLHCLTNKFHNSQPNSNMTWIKDCNKIILFNVQLTKCGWVQVYDCTEEEWFTLASNEYIHILDKKEQQSWTINSYYFPRLTIQESCCVQPGCARWLGECDIDRNTQVCMPIKIANILTAIISIISFAVYNKPYGVSGGQIVIDNSVHWHVIPDGNIPWFERFFHSTLQIVGDIGTPIIVG